VLQLLRCLPKDMVDANCLNNFKVRLERFMKDTSTQCCHINKTYIWLRSSREK